MTTAESTTEFLAAPLDRPTKFVTAAYCAALIGLTLTLPAATTSLWVNGALWALPVLIILLSYGYAPRGYRLTDGRMYVVRRWFGGKTYRLDSAELMPAWFGLGGFRLLGSGGAFGWYGLFWRKGTGRYRAYVTDRSRLVACTGPDGLIVITPRDPALFVVAARS